MGTHKGGSAHQVHRRVSCFKVLVVMGLGAALPATAIALDAATIAWTCQRQWKQACTHVPTSCWLVASPPAHTAGGQRGGAVRHLPGHCRRHCLRPVMVYDPCALYKPLLTCSAVGWPGGQRGGAARHRPGLRERDRVRPVRPSHCAIPCRNPAWWGAGGQRGGAARHRPGLCVIAYGL